jgi:hypothetical protein
MTGAGAGGVEGDTLLFAFLEDDEASLMPLDVWEADGDVTDAVTRMVAAAGGPEGTDVCHTIRHHTSVYASIREGSTRWLGVVSVGGVRTCLWGGASVVGVLAGHVIGTVVKCEQPRVLVSAGPGFLLLAARHNNFLLLPARQNNFYKREDRVIFRGWRVFRFF